MEDYNWLTAALPAIGLPMKPWGLFVVVLHHMVISYFTHLKSCLFYWSDFRMNISLKGPTSESFLGIGWRLVFRE